MAALEEPEQAPAEAPPVETPAGDEEALAPAPAPQDSSKVNPPTQEGLEKHDAAAPKSPFTKEEMGPDGKPPSQKTPREKNPKFKDLEETGAWGSNVSRTEKYVAIGTFALIIAAVIAVVLVFVGKEVEETTVTSNSTQLPTVAPTKIMDPFAKLDLVLEAIDESDFTSMWVEDLPIDTSFYEGLQDDPSATPQQRAMSWILYRDERNISEEVVLRWVLASMYYSLGGENWNHSTGWFSFTHICKWAKVMCDFQNNIQELDLSAKNAVGKVPNELVMLGDIRAIRLDENQLTGSIPGDMFGSMPKLSILYLSSNELTGTIPASLRGEKGHLSKFFYCRFCI